MTSAEFDLDLARLAQVRADALAGNPLGFAVAAMMAEITCKRPVGS